MENQKVCYSIYIPVWHDSNNDSSDLYCIPDYSSIITPLFKYAFAATTNDFGFYNIQKVDNEIEQHFFKLILLVNYFS